MENANFLVTNQVYSLITQPKLANNVLPIALDAQIKTGANNAVMVLSWLNSMANINVSLNAQQDGSANKVVRNVKNAHRIVWIALKPINVMLVTRQPS